MLIFEHTFPTQFSNNLEKSTNLELRKMPFPEFVRDLEGRDAQLFGQQPISIIRIFYFGDNGRATHLALRVLASFGRRRRISLLSAVRRQIVDRVVSLRKLAPA